MIVVDGTYQIVCCVYSNYIRPAALTGQQWNANVMAATAGGGGAAGSPFYQHNLLVVPTNLSIDAIGYREDKQCQTSAYIKRDVSNLAGDGEGGGAKHHLIDC